MNELLLKTLQDYRRKQYEMLADTVYEEKGYDKNSIPTDDTLNRLGFDRKEYFQIVVHARERFSLEN
jgi:aldehyde:ferredoxin oxidoreductase